MATAINSGSEEASMPRDRLSATAATVTTAG